MKKKVFAAVAALMLLSGCNHRIIDTTWKFDSAIVRLPNGEIVVGKVESWAEGGEDDGSDWIEVKIDGTWYHTHLSNVCLMSGNGE